MATLPTDDAGVPTSAIKGDPANYSPGVDEWFHHELIADGADKAKGKKSDAAATSHTADSSVISLLKGVFYRLGLISTTSAAATATPSWVKAEDVAHASGDLGIPAWTVRKDTAAALAGADGEYAPLEVNATGRLHVITDGEAVDSSNASSTALAASLVVKASAGKLFGFQGHVSKTLAAGDYFVQVFDATTATGTPKFSIPITIPATQVPIPFSCDLGERGRAHATGIAIGLSSTESTFTSAGAYMWADAQYR